MVDNSISRFSQEYRDYSFNSDADDAWAQLASLKVFKSASQVFALDCIDVVSGANGEAEKHRLTISNAKDLEDHFSKAPMDARTRFL